MPNDSTLTIAIVAVVVVMAMSMAVPLGMSVNLPNDSRQSNTLSCDDAVTQLNDPPARKTKVNGTNFDYFVCDFRDGFTEPLIWILEMPDKFVEDSEITTKINYEITGTDGVCWDVGFRPLQDGETIDGAFSTLVGACDDVTTATGELQTAEIAVNSTIHQITAGDLIIIKLERDHADPVDTNVADARLISMEMEWLG